VRVDVVEVGRRLLPSAGTRDQVVGRKRGVNDPGVAWPMRPRPVSVGVVHAVSMSGEARAQLPTSGESAGAGRHRSVSRHVSAWTI
jgi:hypothetical protein